VLRGERHARALWDVLAQLGTPTGVIGWPEATPAGERATRPVAFAVSDGFFRGLPGQCWPPELAPRAALFAPAAEQIDPALLAGFGSRSPVVLEALRADLWRGALAFRLLDQPPRPRALFLRLPGLRLVSRQWFGGFAAHQLEGDQGARVVSAARLVEEYYRHVDDYLAQLWAHATGPRLMAVVSPYGAAAPGEWARVTSFGRVPLEGVLSGHEDGLLLLRGDGVRAGNFIADAVIVDVVPTLLYALGLPVARDMDGRPLAAAFDPSYLSTHPLSFVPSYEALGR
jgi:hypothetical protein